MDVDPLSGDEAGILINEEQAGRGNRVDAALLPERDAGGVWQATDTRAHIQQGGENIKACLEGWAPPSPIVKTNTYVTD